MAETHVTVEGLSNLTVTFSTIHEITSCPNSETMISQSDVTVRMNLFFQSDSIAYLHDLKPGTIKYWSLTANQSLTQELYDVVLNDTEIGSWALSLDSRAKVTVLNSDFSNIFLDFSHTVGYIDNLRPGLFASWTLNNISLTNVRVDHWPISFQSSAMTIRRSTITVLMSGSSNLNVSDSTLVWCDITWSNGTVLVNNTTWMGTLTLVDSNFYLSGAVNFADSLILRSWALTNATRNYEVVVVNKTGTTMPKAELDVYNENNASARATIVT